MKYLIYNTYTREPRWAGEKGDKVAQLNLLALKELLSHTIHHHNQDGLNIGSTVHTC